MPVVTKGKLDITVGNTSRFTKKGTISNTMDIAVGNTSRFTKKGTISNTMDIAVGNTSRFTKKGTISNTMESTLGMDLKYSLFSVPCLDDINESMASIVSLLYYMEEVHSWYMYSASGIIALANCELNTGNNMPQQVYAFSRVVDNILSLNDTIAISGVILSLAALRYGMNRRFFQINYAHWLPLLQNLYKSFLNTSINYNITNSLVNYNKYNTQINYLSIPTTKMVNTTFNSTDIIVCFIVYTERHSKCTQHMMRRLQVIANVLSTHLIVKYVINYSELSIFEVPTSCALSDALGTVQCGPTASDYSDMLTDLCTDEFVWVMNKAMWKSGWLKEPGKVPRFKPIACVIKNNKVVGASHQINAVVNFIL